MTSPCDGACGPQAARLVGDPVDTCSGAVVDKRLEFRLTGPLELWWHRLYDSSRSHLKLSLGHGHAHSFERALRIDADAIRYEAPPGVVFEFPLLAAAGEAVALHGFLLRRLSPIRYGLYSAAEPAMEFEFKDAHPVARLRRLRQGQHQILFEYNSARILQRIVDSVGRSVRVIERPDGLLESLTLEGRGAQRALPLLACEYDSRGNLVRTRNAAGHGHAFEYDEANRLVLATGRKGFKFRYRYDAQGRCVEASGDGSLHAVTLSYQVPGRVTQVRRADCGAWRYLFDVSGRLTEVRDPLGGIQKSLYDEAGRLAAEVDPNGNLTRLAYDASGAPVAKVDSLGRRVALPEAPNTPRFRRARVAANPAEFEYGRWLDVRAIKLPDAGQLQALPLPWDVRAWLFPRPPQQEVAATAAEFAVRPLGVPWWPRPSTGRVFNELGKLLEQRDAFGRTRRWQYDAAGNLAEYVDFDGGTWSYDYGAWHFLLKLTNPLQVEEARYTYTTDGQIASFTDAGGTLSEYRYDLKDRLVEVRRHGVVRDTYVRDAAGNLVAKHSSDGSQLLAIEIGPGNLPKLRKLSSGDEHTFEYDLSGRPLVAATKADRVEFAYDLLGNLILEKRGGRGVVHRFADRGRRVASTFFDRFTVRYERPAPGMLSIVSPGGSGVTIQSVQPGIVHRQFLEASSEVIQYDNLGRCLTKLVRHVDGRTWKRRYHWSGEGELRRVEDSVSGEVRHEYDAAHRLRSRVTAAAVEDYEIDAADNLLRQPGLESVALREGNRLASANGCTFAYDGRNHLESRQSERARCRYLYDSRDQLIRIEMPGGPWEAQYDARGRRTRKCWQSRTTEYYWSDDQLIAEIDPGGRVRIYVYTDQLALTPQLFLEYASLEASPESARVFCVFADQIGTPCLVEDEQGHEVWRASIAPFGRATVSASATIELNMRFPGHYLDPETGLHYNRFRYYDPLLGRYLQSDPWGIAGGNNVYAYRLNPLLQVDVRGLGEGNTPDGEDEDGAEGAQRPGQLTPEELDQLYGAAVLPWMVRPGEGEYPPDAQVVRPGEPLELTPGTKYLYIIDENGQMHVAPEDGELGRPTKHTDLAQNGPARVSGELNPSPDDPNMWVMNDDSGRYSWAQDQDGQFQPTRTADQQVNANNNLNQADLGDNTVISEPEMYGDQFDQLGTGRGR